MLSHASKRNLSLLYQIKQKDQTKLFEIQIEKILLRT